jgi:hypothetical protein
VKPLLDVNFSLFCQYSTEAVDCVQKLDLPELLAQTIELSLIA